MLNGDCVPQSVPFSCLWPGRNKRKAFSLNPTYRLHRQFNAHSLDQIIPVIGACTRVSRKQGKFPPVTANGDKGHSQFPFDNHQDMDIIHMWLIWTMALMGGDWKKGGSKKYVGYSIEEPTYY